MFKKILSIALFLQTFLFGALVHATDFKVGESVFVAFPAGNIKDDAFIVGKVLEVMPDGDYRLSVIDYVEGHDYGSSCVPMLKNENANGSNDIWDLWTDTTKLETEKLDYVVPKKLVMKLGYGKTYFVERNNLYIIFGRWLSGAPMMNIERMDMAINTAKINDLADMKPAFELAKLNRKAFYDENGRPLYAFETIKPMVKVMQKVDAIFSKAPELKQKWFARPRDWKALNASTHDYFLVQAIDKVYEDAWNQIYEDGIERADPKDVAKLKQYVKKYKR